MKTPTLNDLAKHFEDLESNVVTLVRRQIVYSEIVISKDEYERIKNEDDNFESLQELRSKMVTDDCMEYVGDEQESWMLFHGDVTSASDDLIFWTDKEWDNFQFLE